MGFVFGNMSMQIAMKPIENVTCTYQCKSEGYLL